MTFIYDVASVVRLTLLHATTAAAAAVSATTSEHAAATRTFGGAAAAAVVIHTELWVGVRAARLAQSGAAPHAAALGVQGRGLHSSTFWLTLSALNGIGVNLGVV